jgi:hypothetical protein
MDNYVYNVIDQYFNTLSKFGYVSNRKVEELLVLIFYFNLLYNDYRGYISSEDYQDIGRALNCFYGNNCLMPYPDYLKMGNLRIGDVTELAQRTKALEEYDKELDRRILDNDLLIEDTIKRIDEHGTRLDEHDKHLTTNDEHLQQLDGNIALLGNQVTNHEGRITTIEATRVVKGKNHIQNIPDINLSAYDLINS